MYGIAQTNTFKFLSTLSLRRATNCKYAAYVRYGISIHALLAESDQRGYEGEYAEPSISIHALLAESDLVVALLETGGSRYFYPRSPCGERLLHAVDKLRLLVISIHALLAESDR